MAYPKFSVVTPSFNQGEFIRQTIDSVLRQNYPSFEHLVMDGGSTDNTVEILRSYPHLTWVSEPDHGQTHALNKGLARTTGDIIAWINSDDWYAPNVFHTVAREIEKHPIVMGSCDIVGRDGELKFVVPNCERTWFDIFKYWCSYSIPTQPAIFFRRDLLEQIRLPNGDYLDENLHYVMDYDLWLRLWKIYPAHRIEQPFAYYRMYDDNKTGQGMEPLLPEMSRVFRRYSHSEVGTEHAVSFVIPTRSNDEQLTRTLDSLAAQTLLDYEVLVVDYSTNGETRASIRNAITARGENPPTTAAPHATYRYIRSPHYTPMGAAHVGAGLVRSLCTMFLEPGVTVSPECATTLVNTFAHDLVAVAVPAREATDRDAAFPREGDRLQKQALFGLAYEGFNLAIRTMALREMGGIPYGECPPLALRGILFSVMYEGWSIDTTAPLLINGAMSHPEEIELLDSCINYVNAQIIVSISDKLDAQDFDYIRATHEWSFSFAKDLIVRARELLCHAPPNWWKLTTGGMHLLEEFSRLHPQFAPAWYYLTKQYTVIGEIERAREAEQNFYRERNAEAL